MGYSCFHSGHYVVEPLVSRPKTRVACHRARVALTSQRMPSEVNLTISLTVGTAAGSWERSHRVLELEWPSNKPLAGQQLLGNSGCGPATNVSLKGSVRPNGPVTAHSLGCVKPVVVLGLHRLLKMNTSPFCHYLIQHAQSRHAELQAAARSTQFNYGTRFQQKNARYMLFF